MTDSSAPLSWADATAIKQLDSHTYEANLQHDWSIGNVPHGGYTTSTILCVAKKHFTLTHLKQNQPHPLTTHVEFPRRTSTGPAIFIVRDVKLGRQTSTLHITLRQNDQDIVLAYINMSNLATEQGVTFPTNWELNPPRVPADVERLNDGADEAWVEQKTMPFAEFRRASSRVRFFFPRTGQVLRSVCDQWVCFRDGSRFTTESLGFVADMFPQVVESYREEDDPYHVAPEKNKKEMGARFWYPTVVLNLDVKKALPEEGVEWLFCRIRSKSINNGRLDIEVVIMDRDGGIVALSHHVTLVLGAARNLAARRKEGKGEESKI
ncbi:hypothetical protein BT63DRAFT_130312 [Microthyrium microscopicum]|uniref:Thioesterase family protein n=1 Tax=Microthyrium microscopicum TaxID=703497 RepID=A0A6A6TWU8_9PEZI|nr:hypothetical protein BT63DRAFT_130312 [Microthyrium microscopicum]